MLAYNSITNCLFWSCPRVQCCHGCSGEDPKDKTKHYSRRSLQMNYIPRKDPKLNVTIF
ncbi:hypothetical protein HOLleu_15560 [Holothuria leucospilota]|uniref:Uncharacterized protein n=1 Tax=Holothuria leucospilota TaxID=206669 RepID=A0A9Q1C4G0_HOLLE|nr:hypothetical protein HOLleu_15560 [Holothuria leucospilota]